MSTDPVIEVTGVWVPNKGAELMAHTGVAELSRRLPRARFVSVTQGPAAARAALGIPGFEARGSAFLNIAAKAMPARFGASALRAQHTGVTHVLDLSGFAYGDHWGAAKARGRAGAFLRGGFPVYIAPQAFGPFEDNDLADEMRYIVTHARRIVARDDISLRHLEALGTGRTIPRLPDITLALPIANRSVMRPDHPYGVLVVNAKTVGVDGMAESDLLGLYGAVAEILRRHGVDPRIVLHEPRADRAISEKLAASNGLEIISFEDARDTKAYVAGAHVAVTGRFHGLANALSTATPAFAVSWSHKYGELLADFGCPDHVFSGDARPFLDQIEAIVSDDVMHGEMVARLTRKADIQKAQLSAFWDDLASDILRN